MKRIQQEALAALRRIVADPKTPAPMRGVKLPQNLRLLGGSYKIDKGEATIAWPCCATGATSP